MRKKCGKRYISNLKPTVNYCGPLPVFMFPLVSQKGLCLVFNPRWTTPPLFQFRDKHVEVVVWYGGGGVVVVVVVVMVLVRWLWWRRWWCGCAGGGCGGCGRGIGGEVVEDSGGGSGGCGYGSGGEVVVVVEEEVVWRWWRWWRWRWRW